MMRFTGKYARTMVGGFLIAGLLAPGASIEARESRASALPANGETCFSPNENCDQKLFSYLSSARSSIDIAIYTITLKELVEILDSAKARGVRIRVVADRNEAQKRTSIVEELKDAGVAIRFGNVEGLMHNKFAIVDRAMVQTGSFNYTFTASEKSAENQLYLAVPQIVGRYQNEFERLWREGTPVPRDFVGDQEFEKKDSQLPAIN